MFKLMTVACSLCAVLGAARPGAAAAPKGPAEALTKLAFLEGSWSCKGEGYDPASGKLKAATGKFTVESTLDKTWLRGTMDGQLDGQADANRAETLLGFDPVRNKFVKFTATNKGLWAYAWADSYEGGTWVWGGLLQNAEGDTDIITRETVAQQGKDSYTVKLERHDRGKWTTLHSGTCSRQ